MSRLTINSNIPSLNAQRSLSNATKKLGDSYTRLSSGLRINKASDDAAGLSISESLKSDTRLFNQGIRNLNDGVSVLAIADGALGELSNIVIRLNELAEQAATGTLGNKQRLALDQEAQSLSKEYNRIARSTEFNGRKIFNGDYGDLSLAAGGGSESLIAGDLGGGIGDGTFARSSSYFVGTSGGNGISKDFNNDGILDLAVIDQFGNTLNIFAGNGDGSFKSKISFVTGSTPVAPVSNDFNNDGVLDIAVSEYSTNSISIFLGNNNGTFKSRITYASLITPANLSLGDINQDGIQDLVTGSASNSIAVHFANNDGSFKSATNYSTGSGVNGLELVDINSDGNLDIVATSQSTASISILIANSDGTFLSRKSYVTGTNPSDTKLDDFNNDGITNIAVSNYDSNNISILFGNADGSFNQQNILTSGINPIEIDSADFNGDGNNDLVVTNYGPAFNGNIVNIYFSNGNGTFKSPISNIAELGVANIDINDFNNDGVADLKISNFTGGSFSIMLGNSTAGVSALQSFSLRTQQDSKDSMTYLRKTLERLGQQRGHIGAFQSRVEFATNNLQTSALSYQEANSRITDIDVAEESSRLAATQILQQSASSILAQANQQPSLVLSLLRNF